MGPVVTAQVEETGNLGFILGSVTDFLCGFEKLLWG